MPKTDKHFENIQYIATTPYIIGEDSYSVDMDFSDAVAGTKLIYRVKLLLKGFY